MAELKKLGRYELRRELGQGAMGVVYEGFDPSLDRRVAVKTIRKNDVIDEETERAYSQRFAREARAVGRLSHPHVVQVYDFGEEGEVAYIVMEYIEGRELRALFDAGERFEPAEAVRIMAELLDALGYAHEAGVIHRDVKPANVILDSQRRVKLADFGVARIQDGTDRSKAGTMVGTPAFMSPEQITGGRIDRRTDLFSAGVVLYQLLTGEQPYKGDGAWTVAKAILQEEPPRPSTIAEQVPAAFDQIINRALAKKPEHRFSNAKDFAAALRGALADSAPGSAASATDAEVEFWRSIQGSSDPAEFRVYLKQFPRGVYAELAQIKLAKLPAGGPQPVSDVAAEVARLAEKEAEYRERDARQEEERLAEEKALAEADARREAELSALRAAAEKARLDAVENEKRAAAAELARREEEYRRREAEAAARAETEARARREAEARAKKLAEAAAAQARAEAEARAKQDAEALTRARREAEELARREAAERARRELEAARREAEAAQREAELKRKLAAAPRAKFPVVPAAVALLAIAVAAVGGWYWHSAAEAQRVAELTTALDAATKANEALGAARRQAEQLREQVASARAAEEDARARGDQVKLKELQEQTRLAEAEQRKQAEVVKQREAEAQKQADALKVADAKKKGESKAAVERAAAEKAAAEKAQAEAEAKAALEEEALAKREAAEAADREKARIAARTPLAAVRQLAIPDPAAAKAAQARAAPAGARASMPAVGDRWVYEAHETGRPERKFNIVVDIASVTATQIVESVKSRDVAAVAVSQRTGAMLSGVATGVASFSPYIGAFQELREGQQWADIEARNLPGLCYAMLACSASGKVAGRERVTVKAGAFDAWRIEILIDAHSNNHYKYFLTFWYSDAVKRTVKYQLRLSTLGSVGLPQSPMDMELVSYAPGSAAAAQKGCSGLAAFKFSDGTAGCLDDYPALAQLALRAKDPARGTNPFVMAATLDLERCPVRTFYGRGEFETGSHASSRCLQSFTGGNLGGAQGCVCEVVFDSREAVDKQYFLGKVRAIEAACRNERNKGSEFCAGVPAVASTATVVASAAPTSVPESSASRSCKSHAITFRYTDGTVGCMDDYRVLQRLEFNMTFSSSRRTIAMAVASDLERCPLRTNYGWNNASDSEVARNLCEDGFAKLAFTQGNISDCKCEVIFDNQRPVDKQVFLGKIRSIEAACRQDRNRENAVCK